MGKDEDEKPRTRVERILKNAKEINKQRETNDSENQSTIRRSGRKRTASKRHQDDVDIHTYTVSRQPQGKADKNASRTTMPRSSTPKLHQQV